MMTAFVITLTGKLWPKKGQIMIWLSHLREAGVPVTISE